MAYIALLEEKLRPALVTPFLFCLFLTSTYLWGILTLRVMLCVPQLHTFWVDAENYANVTRPWFASRSPFPLNFLVPSSHANTALSRILLTKGEAPLHRITEVEGKVNIDLINQSKCCVNMSAPCSSLSEQWSFLIVFLRSTVMQKSAWISSPTDWDQQTTSLATREFFHVFWRTISTLVTLTIIQNI